MELIVLDQNIQNTVGWVTGNLPKPQQKDDRGSEAHAKEEEILASEGKTSEEATLAQYDSPLSLAG